MKSEVTRITERFKKAQIGIKDTMEVIDMTLEDQLKEHEDLFPYEMFEGLNELIDRTVHGTKIERFRPKGSRQPFHTLEIHSEGKEALGYLNMIYLRRPIPSYYLVYVEVLPPFRGRGLGNKILKAFREFVEDADAVGVLDNIILPEEPTYNIYTKLGWRNIEELIGDGLFNGENHYMVFIPKSIKTSDLRDKLIKLFFKVNKKRPIIDMHDNESMVKRTIMEFRSVYEALGHLFEIELSAGTPTPFTRFLYTKYVTKVLVFRRRIATLLGYTGGESLEQISISDQIKTLPIQSYSLWNAREDKVEIWGEEGMIKILPEELKKEPTLFIEKLPFYRRPYISLWMEKKRSERSSTLKISDLLELGFDPTRLREFCHERSEYIFERTSPRFLSSIQNKRRFLSKIVESVSGLRLHNSRIQINPVLALLRDKGNIYLLRRKVEGIHFEEALDQLRTSPHLKEINRKVGIDHVVIVTINEIIRWLRKIADPGLCIEIEDLTFFVPWDIERNLPRVTVDITSVALDMVWIA